MEVYLQGFWLLTSLALLLVVIAGYVMGLLMDTAHRDHSVTP